MSSSSLADSFDGLAADSLPDAAAVEHSPPPIYGPGADPVDFSPELMGHVAENLPHLAEMGCDEGVALREWRRNNAIRLEEKERREKELMSQIVAEAEHFKVDFHTKRKVNCATNQVNNREKEKILVSSLEKVHAEADKNYWKSIAELIPNEVPVFEKKREKRGEEKKPSIAVVQGPKPGKPTELSRMRHLLLKLKHETPSHLELCPTKNVKTGVADGVSAPIKAVASSVEAVEVA